MLRQTIRFECSEDALMFDEHMRDFLRKCDDDQLVDSDACVFTSHGEEQGQIIRVVQTDSPDLLGKLLSFLSSRGFPPALNEHRLHAAERV